LGAKVLSVKYHDSPTSLDFPGATIVKSSQYAVRLEVDTQVTAIESVMEHILKAGSVADITIEDPPLEEVIAHIYSQPPVPSVGEEDLD
jgi:ABC-2 type transport system ATP-binding protein